MSMRALAAKTSAGPKAGPRGVGVLARQCACGQHSIGGATCEGCQNKQRSAARGFAALPAVFDGARRATARAPHKGETRCQSSGTLVAAVTEEHAVGNCVGVHENAHLSDPIQIEGCRRVGKCLARGDEGVPPEIRDPTLTEDQLQGQCWFQYNKWNDEHGPTRAATELKAYTAETACLNDTIDARCGAGATRAGIIGAGVLGAGGLAGGIAGGIALGQATPKIGGTAGGIAGGVLGAGAGLLGGWFLGKGIQRLLGGPQASEQDCQSLNSELTECGIAIDEYKKTANPQPFPFGPDGRIRRDLIRGITKPEPGAANTGSGQPKDQTQPTDKAVSIQTRKASGLRRDARHTNTRAYEDLTSIPTLAALSSPGRPLDSSARAFMEPRFNRDFGRVRIHSDDGAALSARAIDANAYTIGEHIVFASERFAPATRAGRKLLAHELAHVVQNNRTGRQTSSSLKALSDVSDAGEHEAASVAERVVDGGKVEITKSPGAAVQRDSKDTGTALGIVGAIVGAGLVGTGIAWALGAFDSKKKKTATDDGTAKADDEPAQPKLTFEEALKVGAAKLKPEFGHTGGGKLGPDPGDGYDASEWKETFWSDPSKDKGGGAILVSTTSSSWTALDHMFKNIGKDVPNGRGGKTKWSFDCFEFVQILHLYALWRSMDRAELDKAFPRLEIGYSAPRMDQEWQKAFKADGPGQAPYQVSAKDVVVGGSVEFGQVSKVPIKKTWAQLLHEAPVGSQVIFSNIDAIKRCSTAELPFCAYANENATKLGQDSYSAHPFGVTTEDIIRTNIATAVLEYDATLTPKYQQISEDNKKKSFVEDYVKTHLKSYMAKNLFISAIRYLKNSSGPASAGPTTSTSQGR
jgi:hypothetical protein